MAMNPLSQSEQALNIGHLHSAYAKGALTPESLFAKLHNKAWGLENYNIWIHLLEWSEIKTYIEQLGEMDLDAKPLWGVPFAIKDNIDLAGIPTTAGCPSYEYTPTEHAEVVRLLIDAGAIPLGKTNLDQFATGLVGTRSPYGVCHNSFDFETISGGSSSGSSVAVAMGLCSFSLGTDTAGSGRVPAGFNNLIGLKPTKGALSIRGVVPAVKSQDVVSIFALDSLDAESVFKVAAKFDVLDEFSRKQTTLTPPAWGVKPVIGIPDAGSLSFYNDEQAQWNFEQAVDKVKALGYEVKAIDFTPWLETAKLLYGGAWVAERYVAIEAFIRGNPSDMDSTVESIVRSAEGLSAADAYKGAYQLQQAIRNTEAIWQTVDCFMTPTTPTVFKISEVESNPIELNSILGTYTNFMNLLDYSAIAMPSGFRKDNRPVGITLFAPAGSDYKLLNLTNALHAHFAAFAGANNSPIQIAENTVDSKTIPLAVVGAHLSGFPLNSQLLERGAKLLRTTKTAPKYQFYELSSRPILKPGLVKVEDNQPEAASIELEVWAMPAEHLGSFLAMIPSPLGLGKVELEDGSEVVGFICEPQGVVGAKQITQYGGWRNWMTVRAED